MAQKSKRETLIDTATRLFAEHGYHATGIDTILAEAGVAKKTLYNHFRSKEELILAVLRRYDGIFRNSFMKQVEGAATLPREQLLAMFDVAGELFRQNNFFGCMYINAIGEYSKGDTAIRQVCKDFKRLMRDYMKALCDKAQLNDADELADELALLLEGAIVTAQVSAAPEAAMTAKKAAQVLINNASASAA